MALIPTVAAGGPVEATWGNLIRDRAVQSFANDSELKAWAGPEGAHGWSASTQMRFVRTNGRWNPDMVTYGGSFSQTTDATGQVIIPHGLGVTPSAMYAIASSSHSTFFQMQARARSATNVSFNCRNYDGALLVNTLVTGFWLVLL